jgi:hypothetical protein
MKLEIQPYVGVGPIKFGMTIDEVRKVTGEKPKPFRKTPDDVIPTDAFDELGLHIFYKEPGICEAVEMALAADPTFQGQHLIERSFSQILSWLQTIDDAIKVDESGLTSFKFGIGVYAPEAAEQPDAPVEAVIVFEKGYYE